MSSTLLALPRQHATCGVCSLYGEVHIRLLDHPDGVEVTVSVEDLYSRALSPLISGQIDELSFGVVALDYNFRGRGQRLRLVPRKPSHFRPLGRTALCRAAPWQ